MWAFHSPKPWCALKYTVNYLVAIALLNGASVMVSDKALAEPVQFESPYSLSNSPLIQQPSVVRSINGGVLLGEVEFANDCYAQAGIEFDYYPLQSSVGDSSTQSLVVLRQSFPDQGCPEMFMPMVVPIDIALPMASSVTHIHLIDDVHKDVNDAISAGYLRAPIVLDVGSSTTTVSSTRGHGVANRRGNAPRERVAVVTDFDVKGDDGLRTVHAQLMLSADSTAANGVRVRHYISRGPSRQIEDAPLRHWLLFVVDKNDGDDQKTISNTISVDVALPETIDDDSSIVIVNALSSESATHSSETQESSFYRVYP